MKIVNNTSKIIFLVNGTYLNKYSSVIIDSKQVTSELMEQVNNLKAKNLIFVSA